MDNDKAISVVIRGDESGLVASMLKAETSVKGFQATTNTFSSGISKMTGIIGTMTAVLAGGTMFSACKDETIKWTGEASKLSKVLGISTEQASVMNLALGDVYLSMDTMISASDALTKNSLKNSAAFQHYGIALNESNGAQRSTVDIMGDVNNKITSIAQGRDREIAGMQLYGKAWSSVRDIIRLNGDAMSEAAKKAAELHLIVGPEAVADRKKYKAAMNDVEDLFMSMKIQVGNHLLPILTQFGTWIADIGPTALLIFEGALKGIMTFINSVTLGVNILWEVWKAFWGQFTVTSQALVGVISSVLAGDFKNAAGWAKWGFGEFNRYGAEAMDNIIAKSETTGKALAKIWGIGDKGQAKSIPEIATGGVDPYEKDKNGGQMALEDARFKTILAGITAREKANKESAKTMAAEEDYWYRTRTETEEIYQRNKHQIERTALINTKALLDEEISAVEKSRNNKLAISGVKPEEAAKIREEAKKEIADRISEKKTLTEELNRLDLQYFTSQGELQIRETEAQFNHKQRLGQMSLDSETLRLEQLGQEQQADDMRYQGQRQREIDMMQFKLDTLALTEAERQRIIAESMATRELMERQHSAKMVQSEQKTAGLKLQTQNNYLNAFQSVMQAAQTLAGGHNKAMYVATQLAAIAVTFLSTEAAAAAALAPPPLGLGPVVGVPLAASIKVAGYASMAAMAATTIANVAGSGSGSQIGTGGGSPSSPIITQPVTAQPAGQNITIHINNAIGEKKWFEDNLPAILKDFSSRNVNAGVVYA